MKKNPNSHTAFRCGAGGSKKAPLAKRLNAPVRKTGIPLVRIPGRCSTFQNSSRRHGPPMARYGFEGGRKICKSHGSKCQERLAALAFDRRLGFERNGAFSGMRGIAYFSVS